MQKSIMIVTTLLFTFWCCSSDDPVPSTSGGGGGNTNQQDNGWLIDQGEVFDGGPGKDGIPSVDKPIFLPTNQITYMSDHDLINGVSIGGAIKGYTHPVLDWHEIVNDRVGGTPISLTYCPLTGTGSAWNRLVDGKETTFGVSGLLYRNNLIPYDRETDSNWSQLRLQCVQGALKSTQVETYLVAEMSWKTWQTMFPNENVITTETGFARNYGRYPYGDYKVNNNNILFPLGDSDNRLPFKERVLSLIIMEKSRVYTFNHFEDGLNIINDTFMGVDVVVVGSKPDNFMIVYGNNSPLGKLDFKALDVSEGGVIMEDDLGNRWNIFGQAVSGPNEGMSLGRVDAMMGYWFSFGSFYDPEIF
ncbi:MAG: DUF3179 domain-containing protein [Saprospiraceae bacterium]|nr:DUF3179 domain-containing protein [Saprospiraceae bacterium]